MNPATFLLLNQTVNRAVKQNRDAEEARKARLERDVFAIQREEERRMAVFEYGRRQQEKSNAIKAQRRAERIAREETYIATLTPHQKRRLERLEKAYVLRAMRVPYEAGEVSRYIDEERNIFCVHLTDNGSTFEKLMDGNLIGRPKPNREGPTKTLLKQTESPNKEAAKIKQEEVLQKLFPDIGVAQEVIQDVEVPIQAKEPSTKVEITIGVFSIIGLLFVIGYIFMKATL